MYSYAEEKLENILHLLVISEGDIRSRLKLCIDDLQALDESRFPKHLLDDWKYIDTTLNKFGPKMNYKNIMVEGSYEHTLKRIKNVTGSKVAQKLYDIYFNLK